MFKKFYRWLWKLLNFSLAEELRKIEGTQKNDEEDIIFPDAKVLREETLSKVPYITDAEILQKIRERQEENKHTACIFGFRISDETIAKLKKSHIRVRIMKSTVGFDLSW